MPKAGIKVSMGCNYLSLPSIPIIKRGVKLCIHYQTTFEVWEWINNFIPYFTGHVTTHMNKWNWWTGYVFSVTPAPGVWRYLNYTRYVSIGYIWFVGNGDAMEAVSILLAPLHSPVNDRFPHKGSVIRNFLSPLLLAWKICRKNRRCVWDLRRHVTPL